MPTDPVTTAATQWCPYCKCHVPLPMHTHDAEPAAAAHATGALVSTETLTEACRALAECTSDYCAGASEPPTCRFCQRLDIEEPCLLDPIRQEAEGA